MILGLGWRRNRIRRDKNYKFCNIVFMGKFYIGKNGCFLW